jgi:hypothetical protein
VAIIGDLGKTATSDTTSLAFTRTATMTHESDAQTTLSVYKKEELVSGTMRQR